MKKKILYITLTPYLLTFIYCLYHAFFGYYLGYIEKYEYGLDGFIYAFSDVFDYIVFSNWVVLLIAIVIYQIWYFVCEYKTRGERKKDNKRSKHIFFSIEGSIVKKVLFVLSITCWMLWFLYGIYSFFFGYCSGFFRCNIVYGIDAMYSSMLFSLFIFSFIPVLPISLIYIIVYIIKMNKLKR